MASMVSSDNPISRAIGAGEQAHTLFVPGGVGIAHLDDFGDRVDGIVQQPLQAREIFPVFFFDPYPFRHVVHHLEWNQECMPLAR